MSFLLDGDHHAGRCYKASFKISLTYDAFASLSRANKEFGNSNQIERPTSPERRLFARAQVCMLIVDQIRARKVVIEMLLINKTSCAFGQWAVTDRCASLFYLFLLRPREDL